MADRLALPCRTAALLLPALLLAPGLGRAQECRDALGNAQPAVALLTSMRGEVLVNDRPPVGDLPGIPICAGDALATGRASGAALYLVGADTPLRLDEETAGRVQAPPEPGSGLFELARGALYFLSEVRRTLTVRTPYVTAGVEGTEVHLRVAEPGGAGPAAELIVLEGRVALTPGERAPALPAQTVATGERVAVGPGGAVERGTLPGDGGPYAAMRRVLVGQLSWTLFYPDVLVAEEARTFPRVAEAARLLAAGQVAEAERVLAGIPDGGPEAGLRDALRATIAVARKDAATAQALAERAVAAAPAAATPLIAQSYARQLALDLDGALAAAEAAAAQAPRASLPQARLAELHLMRGETRQARAAARRARERGGGPLAEIALGYAELAALRGRAAEEAFRRALAAESWNPLGLLGLGLAQIKQGDLEEGRRQIENAVAHDPSSSLLRSYLGKGYFEERRDEAAGTQFAIAKDLDPEDPTPWFYDAIRKQLDNRPVEALRDLERSIELNDNRAPFRSRLLLDQDRATRGTSLARIYQDLGFDQLGINEASRALAIDPENGAAHRFLADLYRGEPRLEAARVSELLQSQLLQPVGLNPVQPSLPFTDLNIPAAAGPAQVTFNEFTPVFQKDGWQLSGTGLLGTQQTRANELTATMLRGRTSLSLGQFFYDTDGFRENDQLQHRIYTIFGQWQVTDNLDLQAEFRRRETNQGDRRLNFDLEDYDRTLRESIDQNIFRLGGRLRLSSSTSLLVSGAYSNRNERARSSTSEILPDGTIFDAEFRDRNNTTGRQLEAQYITGINRTKIVTGAGIYRVNVDNQIVEIDRFPGELFRTELISDPKSNVDAHNLYTYTLTRWPQQTLWTAGLGIETVDVQGRRESELTPKIGVDHQVTDNIGLRLAAFRTIKRELVAQQTIEPTLVSGFNQLFDDVNGTKADQVAAGVDVRLTPSLAVGIEGAHRQLSAPLFDDDPDGIDVVLGDADESVGRLYLYWTPTDRIAVSTSLFSSRFRQHLDEGDNTPNAINSWLVPISARYFHPSGFFAGIGARYLNQSVTRQQGSGESEKWDDAVLFDGSIGYRFPNRRGIASLEISNLLDEKFRWQDDTFRSSEQQNRRFIPERAAMIRLTLIF